MQAKFFTSLVTVLLLVPAVRMSASSKPLSSYAATIDNAARLGGIASLVYFTGKSANWTYNWCTGKKPSAKKLYKPRTKLDETRILTANGLGLTNERITEQAEETKTTFEKLNEYLEDQKKALSAMHEKQRVVEGTLFGDRGISVAEKMKPTKTGLIGAFIDEHNEGIIEFSEAYQSALVDLGLQKTEVENAHSNLFGSSPLTVATVAAVARDAKTKLTCVALAATNGRITEIDNELELVKRILFGTEGQKIAQHMDPTKTGMLGDLTGDGYEELTENDDSELEKSFKAASKKVKEQALLKSKDKSDPVDLSKAAAAPSSPKTAEHKV